MLNKLHSTFKSTDRLKALEDELNQLMAEEGEKSGRASVTTTAS